MTTTHNGDPTYDHSGDHQLEFFSKAGSLIKRSHKKGKGKGKSAYGAGTETTALSLFQPCWLCAGTEAKVRAMQLLFWLRNPRGGAGNRDAARDCMRWLAQQPDNGDGSGAAWLAVNLMRIPEWGRWNDLAQMWKTPLERMSATLWSEAIKRGDHLACKWAKADMWPIQRILKTNERGLRKLIVPHRANTPERAMCAKDWSAINYSHVPSQAMKLHSKAFEKQDAVRFKEYKAALASGTGGVKVNASTLWPHDCLIKAQTDPVLGDAQFAALPDFVGPSGRRMLAIADTSGSMGSVAIAPATNMDVAVALALYLSDRLGPENPFYRRYMEFSSNPYWVDWRGKRFAQQARERRGEVASTNIQATLDYLLDTARAMAVPADKMITHLVLISDMQFDTATTDRSKCVTNGIGCVGTERTVVEKCMARWEAAGYKRPTIIYWNLAGYAGNPARLDTPNTALVSGFSPSILESVVSGQVVSPMDTMLKTLAKYQIEAPVTE